MGGKVRMHIAVLVVREEAAKVCIAPDRRIEECAHLPAAFLPADARRALTGRRQRRRSGACRTGSVRTGADAFDAYRSAGKRSGNRSRPRQISKAFFTRPTTGTALSPVSSDPLITPLRRIVAATVATANTVPTIGIDRRSRRDNLAPPYRVTLRPILMRPEVQNNGQSQA